MEQVTEFQSLFLPCVWKQVLCSGTQCKGEGRLARSQGLGSACAISSQFTEWTSCHCWSPWGHSDPSLYLLPRWFVCSGTTWAWWMWSAAKRTNCISWNLFCPEWTQSQLSTFSLHGYLGSSQWSDCGCVINKLIATLLWCHVLPGSVELQNFFWKSLHLHPAFSEYSIPDKFFPAFLITSENLAAFLMVSIGS